MAGTPGNNCNSSINIISILLLILILNGSNASLDVLPDVCDNIKCPPMSEINCPEDSDVSDALRPIALLITGTAAPTTEETYNTSAISEEFYAQCCLRKKCICKTCYIIDCHNAGEVVFELRPESPETPGNCCGEYKCQLEPNCNEVRDTENFWLTDCQRCRCHGGVRMCHQICDEDVKKSTAICNSKNLNTFFEHGHTWKDGCYECECVNGEEKCVLPFCKSVNCPPQRQVMLKERCCPVCWPKDIPMPNTDENDDDDVDDDDDDVDDDDDDDNDYDLQSGNHQYKDNDGEEPLIHIGVPQIPKKHSNDGNIFVNNDTATTKATDLITSITTTTTTAAATTAATVIATNQNNKNNNAIELPTEVTTTNFIIDTRDNFPCELKPTSTSSSIPATYQLYPEVVEVVHKTHNNDFLYFIIGFLVIIIILLSSCNIRLRSKQRSYRPVSNFDDNFNKMSSNIKKMNDLA